MHTWAVRPKQHCTRGGEGGEFVPFGHEDCMAQNWKLHWNVSTVLSGVVAVSLLNHILLRYLILLLLLADDEVSSFKYSITSIKKSFVFMIVIIFSMYLTGMLVQIEGFGSNFRGKPLISVNNYFKNISPLKLQRQKTVPFPYFRVLLLFSGRKFLLCALQLNALYSL